MTAAATAAMVTPAASNRKEGSARRGCARWGSARRRYRREGDIARAFRSGTRITLTAADCRAGGLKEDLRPGSGADMRGVPAGLAARLSTRRRRAGAQPQLDL